MSTGYTPAHLARGAIGRARMRLADKYVFHTKLLEKFKLSESSTVKTMGVSALPEGVRLHFDPEFVNSLPYVQLGGVLLHEVHHVVLGHLAIDTKDYADRWAITVAMELCVNEFVKEPLPQGCITLEQFPDFPPMESTQQRYERLKNIPEEGRLPLAGPTAVLVDVGSGGQGTGKGQGKGTGKGKGEGGLVVLDNHDVWEALGPQGQQALADAVQEAAEEAGGLPKDLADALERMRAVGHLPGDGVQILADDTPGQVDWRTVLRRYVGRVLRPRPTYNRPPRRFPDLVGVLPGRQRRRAQASVVAVLDTSGSVEAEELERFNNELVRISKMRTVHVVQADSAIHKVSRYRGKLSGVEGRGGTDFRPALEAKFLRSLRAELVLYFTDGYGPAPDKAPYCPVVWCLVPGGRVPAAWGRVVQMD